jgi:hypothetical protein
MYQTKLPPKTVLFLLTGLAAVVMSPSALTAEAPPQTPTVLTPFATKTVQAHSFDMPLGASAPTTSSGRVVGPLPRSPMSNDVLNNIKKMPGARGPVTMATMKSMALPAPNFLATTCMTNSSTGDTPPDIIGAVGFTNIIVTTRQNVGVYNKSNCLVIGLVSLATFFSAVSGEFMFDPQVLWDFQNNRYIVTAIGLLSDRVTQNQHFAISKDSTGTSWWVYKLEVANAATNFCSPNSENAGWDYDHVGSLDGSNPRWLITANIIPFAEAASSLLTIDKTSTLVGAAATIKCFTSFQFNLMPTYVMDNNDTAYLLSPGSGSGSAVQRYALNSDNTVTVESAIAITPWTAPANALQPNGIPLDSWDGRFESRSVQNGGNIWNVHNVAVGNRGLIRAYQFDTSATSPVNMVTLSTTDVANPSDNLFSASITVNNTNAFISASRTIPSIPGTGNAAMLILVGPRTLAGSWSTTVVATSTTQFNGSDCDIQQGCRWGDFSAIQIDPSNANKAWAFNELITGPSQANWTTEAALQSTSGGSSIVTTHDFNGDGKSDIAWRDSSGNAAVWLMNGTQLLQSARLGSAPTAWSVVGQRDFNGDGKSDWLWRDTSGNTAVWFLNGLQVSSAVGLGNVPTAWSVVGTGDFDGNGTGDILWRDTSGNVAVWLMNGGQVLSSGGLGNIPTTWSIVGTGDFNGDGKSDILWRDTSGNVAIWLLNGSQIVSSAGLGNIPATWSVVGIGDFNGDRTSDIVWRDTSGNVAVWLMNAGQIALSGGLGTVPTTWSIAETGDFDGDGKSDLLWRDGSGNVAIWFMNGLQIKSTASLGNVPVVWRIQNANAD